MFFLRKITEQPQPLTKPNESKDIVKGMFQEKVQDQRCAAAICGDRQHSLLKEFHIR